MRYKRKEKAKQNRKAFCKLDLRNKIREKMRTRECTRTKQIIMHTNEIIYIIYYAHERNET